MMFGLSPQATMLASLATPLAGALLIALTRNSPNLRETMTLLSASLTFALVASLYPLIMGGGAPTVRLIQMLPGLELRLALEPLGMLFALVASFLWIVTSIYAIGYMRGHHEHNQTRFYLFFAVAIAATLGIALAGDMLTLFVFYEALTLSTIPLVCHTGTPQARRAGRVYMGILIGTSVGFLLIAIIWTWSLTGTLDFKAGGILQGKVSGAAAAVLLVLYVYGIGKAALMPFHRWLPAAMVAPTPVSALLHAVAVVKAGVFGVLKVSYFIFGLGFLSTVATTEWLQYIAAATIVIASLVAMTKDNLKARLAYSTISQLSYIVLGALLADPLGFIGGSLHIATHAFAKITLFFCAGAIMVVTDKTKVSQMSGLGRTMPLTMAAFMIGAMSIIGLPPTGGLWSKWYLALGSLQADKLFFVGVLMFSSLLNIAYLLPIPLRAFFGKPPDGEQPTGIREAPTPMLIAIAITVAGSVALFFYPEPVYDLIKLLVV